MELNNKKTFFFTLSIVILLLCIIHTLIVYKITLPPEFVKLTSTRLLGANERDIFIEMTWTVKNVSLFPYVLDNTNLYFHEQEIQIARVFFEDAVLINAFADSKIKVNAAINRDVFERLIRNSIDDYSFDLRGTAEAKFLFVLARKLSVTQHIPINITNLVTNFLQDSFKNAIYLEQILLAENYINCIIAIINRPGFKMDITAFEGNIQIGKSKSGRAEYFYTTQFSPEDIKKTTRLRFTTEQNLIDKNFSQSYFIEGLLTVILWGREYNFPIKVVGDS